jgi:hypothetical protein
MNFVEQYLAEARPVIERRDSKTIGRPRHRWRDVEAGRRAGCVAILIDHRYAESGPNGCAPDHIARSLVEAAAWILTRAGAREGAA